MDRRQPAASIKDCNDSSNKNLLLPVFIKIPVGGSLEKRDVENYDDNYGNGNNDGNDDSDDSDENDDNDDNDNNYCSVCRTGRASQCL